MRVTAIVVAAGRGLRLESSISKPLVKIGRLPLIVYCLKTLSRNSAIKNIIIAANRNNLEGIRKAIQQYRIPKVNNIVLGGRSRQISVRNSLAALGRSADLVLIHDAARPFITSAVVSCAIKAAKKTGAAVIGIPARATFKSANPGLTVKTTLNRNNLWEIQTPQVFRRDLIIKAHHKFSGGHATDDASLVERLGRPVKLVMGSPLNIKITGPEDLFLARAIAGSARLK